MRFDWFILFLIGSAPDPHKYIFGQHRPPHHDRRVCLGLYYRIGDR